MSKTVATDFGYATALRYSRSNCAHRPTRSPRLSAVVARPAARRSTQKPARGSRNPLGKAAFEDRLAIYEAGGGSTSFLPLDIWNRAHVTVVDIDADQIRNNDYAQEKILGDIQTYRFKPDSFDLVICYNVIEHLPDARSALLGFCESLKQDGLILIGAPNPKSLSGIVTKYTPHWFHVWFYRHVLGDKNAGTARRSAVPNLLPSAGDALQPRCVREGHMVSK